MINKIIFSIVFVSLLWSNSTENTDKFLVIDSKTYNKIENLNVLNGGIKTDYVIYNKLIDNSTLKKFYPEIFAYNGQKCYTIQSINISTSNKKNINIKKEIEKLRILNLLHNTSNKYKIQYALDIETIKAVGIICDYKLHIRNKDYMVGDNIGKFYIKSINTKNDNLILGIK